MADQIKLIPPLSDDIIVKLRAGDRVVFTGVIYNRRGMADKRKVEGDNKGKKVSFDMK